MIYKLTPAESRMQKKLKRDLRRELTNQEKDKSYYFDLIDQYCEMYAICRALAADIKERGVSIAWQNGENQKGHKKNDSISEFTKTNMQMLKILGELGLRGANIEQEQKEELGSLI